MNSWLVFIPPFLSIFLAFLFRQVHLALLVGIFSGIFILHGIEWQSISLFFDNYLIKSLTDSSHVYVLIFSFFIGGLIHLISENGSMYHLVKKLSLWATSQKSTEWITYLLGIFIFFDDYANTMIVGKTMQPLCDKQGVSREKLAYLVDSTAAPMAGIAFISTWIGAELGYIQEGLTILNLKYSAYEVFLNSLKFAFYPIFTLFFIAILIWKQKDFGPMFHAKPIVSENETEEKQEYNTPYYYAIISIALLIGITFFGLWITGKKEGTSQSLHEIISNADVYKSLLWGSGLACFFTILFNLFQKITFNQSIEILLDGFKTMISAMSILVLAWILGTIIKELELSTTLIIFLKGSHFSLWFLPILIFIIAGLMSFATGSSWGTMAILYVICIPLSWKLALTNGMNETESFIILTHCVASVLAGAIFGDHCSPISDTTILSSMASNCNHLEHVKTQLPYAISVGIVSLLISFVANWGLHWTINYVIGFILLYLVVHFVGKNKL